MESEKIKAKVIRINRLIQKAAGVRDEDIEEDFYVAIGMYPSYDEDSYTLSLGDEDENEYFSKEGERIEKSGQYLSMAESWEDALRITEKVCFGKKNIAEIRNFIGGDENETGKKVSFTGTFDVPRKELEEILADAGHEIVPLSKKTQVFLIGEKTASPKKIARAESLGVAIFNETDAEKILALLNGNDQSKTKMEYCDHRERAGEVFEAGINNILDVYWDYISWQQDNGEWAEDDCLRALENPEEIKNDLTDSELAIHVADEDEEKFFSVFRRIILIDYINQKFCEQDGDIAISDIRAFAALSDEKFFQKLLRLEFLDFGEDNASNKLEYILEEFEDWSGEVKRLAELF